MPPTSGTHGPGHPSGRRPAGLDHGQRGGGQRAGVEHGDRGHPEPGGVDPGDPPGHRHRRAQQRRVGRLGQHQVCGPQVDQQLGVAVQEPSRPHHPQGPGVEADGRRPQAPQAPGAGHHHDQEAEHAGDPVDGPTRTAPGCIGPRSPRSGRTTRSPQTAAGGHRRRCR